MIRLDLYLNNFGYVKSRQRAKKLIEDGYVTVNSRKILKPSFLVDEEKELNIEICDPCPYVSRGGMKLQMVFDDVCIDINNKIAIDIGASTGGFTDCLLKRGARRVYAIDSGSNQLDDTLLNNESVISIENYNARNICYEDIGEFCDFITIDVSFISQTLIMPNAFKLLKNEGKYISLIKPQFEAGKDKIGKGGIVKNAKYRLYGALKVINCAGENGFNCTYLKKSPIWGGDGNIEFLAIFEKDVPGISNELIKKIILEN